ncbi:DUF3060 domain-containing protein [Curtobacterium sp. 24E2]|nr:DUF3060 domain-containing protein [Curtobacterium sp. 24E2]
MNTLLTRGLAATTITIIAALGVTACSSAEKAPKTSASATSTATPAATKYNECIDGAVQLWDEDSTSDETITAADCDAANLISSDRTYELSHVGTITVEAKGTTIAAKDVQKVAFTGNDNRLTYTGAAPEVDDQGSGNTVEAAVE